jgi:DeoR/GlpR family transcriptional regulator of sugar metabolism
MFAEERRNAILQILQQSGRLKVDELSRDLGVSKVTIRQDLEHLEQLGMLLRAHGGAILNNRVSFERPFQMEETAFKQEKERIGKAAAGLIKAGETVILDVGTTVTAAARQLKNHPELTVITNALNIALLFEDSPQIDVLVTGGTLRPQQHSLVNPYGKLLLEQIRADVALIGVNGVSASYGITNANGAEAEMKQLFIRSAARRIVLADSGKIGNIAFARFAGISDIDHLITDEHADQEELDKLREMGLSIQVV